MTTSVIQAIGNHYHWQLSLAAAAAIVTITLIATALCSLNPTFKHADQRNAETFRNKMEQPHYAANQRWNRKWAPVYLIAVFGVALPFCVTIKSQHWWMVVRDVVLILFVYDFFYYFMHRFMFHNGKVFGGRLLRVHAIHHQQHNPCRKDSSYIHPLEVAMGLGLYTLTIFVLSRFMGEFHLATIVITFIAFSEINLHNHTLWEVDHFPFQYLDYLSRMHHNHHAKFTGGNFGTISLLFDWMFGTLDNGSGYKSKSIT